MQAFKKILLLLTEDYYQKEIKVIQQFLTHIKPEKLFIAVLTENHDYFDLDNFNIKKEIKDYLQKNLAISYEFLDKHSEDEIIKFILTENIDLSIMYNYRENNALDEYIIKFILKLNSNILLIPGECEEFTIKKIMVATDFSDYSREALEYGKYIQSIFKESQLKLIHIAAVPVGYHYTGLSLEEFSNKLKENAVLKMKEFLKESIPYEIHSVYKHKNVVPEILNIAAAEKTDLVIFGSQGASSKLDFLYVGSSTMQMVNIHSLPLLIVKIKEKQKSLLEKILLNS